MKVFISTTTFAEYDREPLLLLEKNGFTYELNPLRRKLTENELVNFLSKGNFSGLLAGTETINRKAMESSSALKVISRVGVGLDNVDMAAAKTLKIKVKNTPSCLTDSVAELTLGMILSALRKLTLMDSQMHKGAWKKEIGFLLKGKTVGIVGFGKIGARVAELAGCFGATVIFCDLKKIKNRKFQQVGFAEIVSNCDIITFHVPAKKTMVAKDEISMMKQGVILINTSRGAVIDEDCLYDGLVSGKIGFAALDVYGQEPYSGKLAGLDNIMLTPHIGSYAREARVAMEIEAVENLVAALTK